MSQPIASCPLAGDDDQKHHLHLYASFLEVVIRGKTKKYALSPLMRLEVNHRQLLGPLVGGGLLSCLAFITLFTLSKWALPLLFLGIGGLGLVYFGIAGVHVLTLREDKIHYDVPLPGVSQALLPFVKFYNSLIPGISQGASGVFPAYLSASTDMATPDGAFIYLDRHDLNERVYIAVDLMKLGTELTFEFDKIRSYRARVGGPIPAEAIIQPSGKE